MFAIGLSLSGVFQFGSSLSGVGQSLSEKSGAAGDFFTGVLAVIVASPCTAPFMAGALGYAFTAPALPAMLVVSYRPWPRACRARAPGWTRSSTGWPIRCI